jgi:hypothetical protein
MSNVLPFLRPAKPAPPFFEDHALLIAQGRSTHTRLGLNTPTVAKLGFGMLCGVSIVQAIEGLMTIHDCASTAEAAESNCIFALKDAELGLHWANTPIKSGIVVIIDSGVLAISFN